MLNKWVLNLKQLVTYDLTVIYSGVIKMVAYILDVFEIDGSQKCLGCLDP